MAKRLPRIGPKVLVVTWPTRADIDGQLRYLAETAGLDVALRFADTIDAALMKLARVGSTGVARDRISPGLRMLTFGRFCVYFRATDTELRIIRFLAAARDVDDQFFDD